MGNNESNGKVPKDLGLIADKEQTQHKPMLQVLTHLQWSRAGDRETDDAIDELEEADETSSELDPKVQAHLGMLLRRMYNALLDEPVPDKLMELLKELEHSEKDE
jgi:hypothetical protein